MKLLYTKRSPYARKVRVFALEKGISLDLVEENLTAKSDGLLSANPLGKVPSLILDDGRSLCDSPVICEYLESLKPSPALIPAKGEERFRVLHLAAIADGLMDNTVSLYMEKQRHPKDFHQGFVDNQEKAIAQTLGFFTDNVKELAQFNYASVAVASAIGYLNFRLPHLNPSGKFQKLNTWYAEFSKRPSMAETMPIA